MCLTPIRINLSSSLKRKDDASEWYMNHPEYHSMLKDYEVPCGKCYQCTSAKRNGLVYRLQSEFKYFNKEYKDKHFFLITLTYDDNSIPKASIRVSESDTVYSITCFNKRHMPNFIRQVKRDMPYHNLSYFYAGEYGSNGTQRPHLHCILLFGSNDTILSRETIKKRIRNCWKHGSIDFGYSGENGHFESKAMQYVAKYTTKGYKEDSEHFFKRIPTELKDLGVTTFKYLDKVYNSEHRACFYELDEIDNSLKQDIYDIYFNQSYTGDPFIDAYSPAFEVKFFDQKEYNEFDDDNNNYGEYPVFTEPYDIAWYFIDGISDCDRDGIHNPHSKNSGYIKKHFKQIEGDFDTDLRFDPPSRWSQGLGRYGYEENKEHIKHGKTLPMCTNDDGNRKSFNIPIPEYYRYLLRKELSRSEQFDRFGKSLTSLRKLEDISLKEYLRRELQNYAGDYLKYFNTFVDVNTVVMVTEDGIDRYGLEAFDLNILWNDKQEMIDFFMPMVKNKWKLEQRANKLSKNEDLKNRYYLQKKYRPLTN